MLINSIVKFYDKQDGWIECGIKYNIMYVSAHCEGDKYSRPMLRKLLEFGRLFGVARTQLRFDYLVKFYSKHFNVTPLGDDMYEIRIK